MLHNIWSRLFLIVIFIQWVLWLSSQVLFFHYLYVWYIRLIELIFIELFNIVLLESLWRMIFLRWLFWLLSIYIYIYLLKFTLNHFLQTNSKFWIIYLFSINCINHCFRLKIWRFISWFYQDLFEEYFLMVSLATNQLMIDPFSTMNSKLLNDLFVINRLYQ